MGFIESAHTAYETNRKYVWPIEVLEKQILQGKQKKGKHRSNAGANRARQRLFEQTIKLKKLKQKYAEFKLMKLLNQE